MPVGLVWASYGGTNVETWTPTSAREVCGEGGGAPSRFNAMIAPLMRNPISCVIWYQGESNWANYQHYACTFPAMIQSWRDGWHNATGGISPMFWPFGFVQLSVHDGNVGIYGQSLMPDRSYAPVRWAQTAGFGAAPNVAMPKTFMASAVDIGQRNSPAAGPHVQNKQDVPCRLVLAYQREFLQDGAIFAPGLLASSALLEGGDLTVDFNSLSPKGLRSPLPSQLGFEMSAGDDVWVTATSFNLGIGARSVILSVPQGLIPIQVRYLWAMNPCLPELGSECPLHDADGNGFPALPFVLNVSTSLSV